MGTPFCCDKLTFVTFKTLILYLFQSFDTFHKGQADTAVPWIHPGRPHVRQRARPVTDPTPILSQMFPRRDASANGHHSSCVQKGSTHGYNLCLTGFEGFIFSQRKTLKHLVKDKK